MNKFMTSIYNLISTWQPLVWLVVAISFIAVGVMCIVPSQELKQKATKALPWIVGGTGIALLASTLAREIAGAFGF